MIAKISYNQKSFKKDSKNLILFCGEKFQISNLKKILSTSEFNYISDLLKNTDLKKNLLFFDINSKKKIALISIKKNLKNSEIENLGAEFFRNVNKDKYSEYFLVSDSIIENNSSFLGFFLHGFKLKSYEFKKYKSKKETKVISINVIGKKNIPSNQNQLRFKAIEKGAFFTRDLVSEPGNILHPDEYAKRLKSLKKDGLKVTIYDEKKLKKLGMYSLLGVGMGSVRGSYLVIMEWKGANNNSKPLAFVGKGVTFDTGGYSLNQQGLWKI